MWTEQGACNHWIGAALDFESSRLPAPPIGLQRGTGKPYASPPPDGFLKGESSMGESVSHKSSRRRADAQWIVTTRLLYHLHDPAELLSRMQRIYPRAPLNCNTPAGKQEFHHAPLPACSDSGPKAYSYPCTVCGVESSPFLAWILT